MTQLLETTGSQADVEETPLGKRCHKESWSKDKRESGEHKQQTQQTIVYRKLFRLCFVLALVSSFCNAFISKRMIPFLSENDSIAAKDSAALVPHSQPSPPRDLSPSSHNCSISFNPPQKKNEEWRTKPLWIPSYPNSGASGPSKEPGDIVSPLVNLLTGLKTGTKNYHVTIRGGTQKRCRSIVTETAGCTQGHPTVPVGPEKHTQNFDSRVILVVRNFATAFPAAYNDKAIAYHNHVGQVDEEDWRMARDRWMKGSFADWKNLITEWKRIQMDGYYKIAIYVPYEHLLDANRGPALTKRLAVLFRQAGFPTAPLEDISCMWYTVIQGERTRRSDFYNYTPGYTRQQKEWLDSEMQSFISEVTAGNDAELSGILMEYVEEIRNSVLIDQPWTNTSDDKT